MFDDGFIYYNIVGKTCVITYHDDVLVTNDEAEYIVRLKNELQEKIMITRFVGIINWSKVSMKGMDIGAYTTEEALRNVSSIAVVHLSDSRFKRFFYTLGCTLINKIIPTIKTRGIRIKFFTNINNAINWSNEQV